MGCATGVCRWNNLRLDQVMESLPETEETEMGYQVFVYEGCYTSTKTGRIVAIAGRVLFGGQVFATKGAAQSAWYDTCPDRNDRMTIKEANRA